MAIFTHFQNGLIFRILAVCSRAFLHKTTAVCCINFFSVLYLHFKFLTEGRPFGKGMAFALARAVAFCLWPFFNFQNGLIFRVTRNLDLPSAKRNAFWVNMGL